MSLIQTVPLGGGGKDGRDGRPIQVDSVTHVGRENTVTLLWEDDEGADHTIDVVILDGAKGEKGDKGDTGEQGPKGEDGRSFSIQAQYESEEAMRQAHPTGNNGDAYLVDNALTDTPDLWFWSTQENDWICYGPLSGAKGDKGDKGDKGNDGFSPDITVAESGEDVYKLRVTTKDGSFVTANLAGKSAESAPDAEFSSTSRKSVENRVITARFDEVQNKNLSSSMTIGETTATTVEDALAALNNKAVDVDNALDTTSSNPISNSAAATELNAKQTKNLNTPLSIGGSSRTTVEAALGALNTELDNKVPKSAVGAKNGVAELDANGKVPASQLPSFVDDVTDCYYDEVTEKLYKQKDKTDPENPIYSEEITPVDDKLYADKDSSILYRWTGSILVSTGGANGVAIGETAQTAYRGDRGKIAYETSQANKENIGTLSNLTTTEKTTLVDAINEVKGNISSASTTLNQVANKQNKTLSSAVTVDNVSKTTVEDAISALATLANYNKGNKLNQVAIADVFDETATYEEDEFVIYDNKLYKTKNQHTGNWVAADFEETQVMDEIVAAMISDYNSLQNRPQIAGVTLTGNKTYSDLGLQQSETGKGLSTNDYTNAAKEIVEDVKGHTGKSVTDTNGAHGLKVTNVSEDVDEIYYKSGNDWKKIQFGAITQLEEIPSPASKYAGRIYQYVGTTTENYKKGYFYECISSGGVYAWAAVRVQAGGGQTIQYDPMPTAEASLVGALYQYVGTTTANYKRGHFYECVAGETESTFVWKEVEVDTVVFSDQDIADIKAAFDRGLNGEEETPVDPEP